MTTVNGHGGARIGAGRKPKAILYANDIAVAESMMVGALPRVTAKLIALAEAGDIPAIRLLFDRIMGRPAQLQKPLSKDTSIPYVEDDMHRDLMGRFLNAVDIDDMHDRQFAERFVDLREDEAVDEEAETGIDSDNTQDAERQAGEPSPGTPMKVSGADDEADDESDKTPRYYYVGNEVKFGIPPSDITARRASPPESRDEFADTNRADVRRKAA